jgi:hypothetical protein
LVSARTYSIESGMSCHAKSSICAREHTKGTAWDVTYGEVPELGRVGAVVDALLRVLVPAVVAEPDIKALLDEYKRDRALLVREANPYLTEHMSDDVPRQ